MRQQTIFFYAIQFRKVQKQRNKLSVDVKIQLRYNYSIIVNLFIFSNYFWHKEVFCSNCMMMCGKCMLKIIKNYTKLII